MTAHREGPTLTVTVENPCDPDRLRTRGVGLGLELLRQRLTTEFGVDHAVRAEETVGAFQSGSADSSGRAANVMSDSHADLIRVVIVDDEALARGILREWLAEHADIK